MNTKNSVLVIFLIFGFQSYAGLFSEVGKAAANLAVNKSLEVAMNYSFGPGVIGHVATETGSELMAGLLVKPVFEQEKPSVDPKSLITTATKTAAAHYSVPWVTHGAMYVFGMSAAFSPILAFVVGIFSQFAVGQLVHTVVKGIL